MHAPAAPRCCGALQLPRGRPRRGPRARPADHRRPRRLRPRGDQRRRLRLGHEGVRPPARATSPLPRAAFAEKVRDVTEVLAAEPPRAERNPLAMKVAYHDACHLAHAQGIRQPPRELLRGDPRARAARARRTPRSAAARPASTTSCSPRPRASSAAARPSACSPPAPRPWPPPTPAAPSRSPRTPRRRAARCRSTTPPAAGRSIAGTGSAMSTTTTEGVEVHGAGHDRADEMLTAAARWPSSAALHREFDARRRELLSRAQGAPGRARRRRHARLPARDRRHARRRLERGPGAAGARRTAGSRSPGPTDRQDGHQRAELRRRRLHGRLRGLELAHLDQHGRGPASTCATRRTATIEFSEPDGKRLRLDEETATLLVRPRGWHLVERHVTVDGEPVAGAFFDFGLYFFHNARRLHRHRRAARTSTCPRLESHLEARLWNDVFVLRRGRARDRPRDDQGDRADRDHPGRVRDGRDPLRAARPLGRAERRPLGLHLLDDQVLPDTGRTSCCPTAPR